MMSIMYTKLQNYSLCYRQTKLYICAKCQNYNIFMQWASFCTKDHQTQQAMSNLNRKFRKKLTLI